jgi:hypothetical protein
VLVDTSVWIDFFNGHPNPAADALARLIDDEADILTCGLVAAELLQGVRRDTQRAAIDRHLRDMEWLSPHEPDTYVAAAELFRNLRARGVTIRSTIDCIIAQLAAENGALLLAHDKDLRAIARSGLLAVQMLPTI